ncbi:MAG TPA: hypothetical protein VGH93_04940 [Solirubrobacteraceae bacterium]
MAVRTQDDAHLELSLQCANGASALNEVADVATLLLQVVELEDKGVLFAAIGTATSS